MPGRPALACDLIEPLRVPVVDRWIEEVSAKGLDGKALVEKARGLIDKHSAK